MRCAALSRFEWLNMKIKKEVGEKILRCTERIVALFESNRALGASEKDSSVAAVNQAIREYQLTDEEKNTLFIFLEYNWRMNRMESARNN